MAIDLTQELSIISVKKHGEMAEGSPGERIRQKTESAAFPEHATPNDVNAVMQQGATTISAAEEVDGMDKVPAAEFAMNPTSAFSPGENTDGERTGDGEMGQLGSKPKAKPVADTTDCTGRSQNGGSVPQNNVVLGNSSGCEAAMLRDEDRLPNFTLGREIPYYDYPISEEIVIDDLQRGTQNWRYEKIKQGIRITPLAPGEWEIPIEYANRSKRCVLHLTVNPDPWSLWQIKEPTDEALVFEEDKKRRDEDHHQNIVFYENDGFQVMGASRRGRSHEHAGTFRDDDMGFWADENTGRYVFIVSDGAGSCKYSREGSRLAIKFILEKLDANLSATDWGSDGQEMNPTGKIGMKLAGLVNYANSQLKKYVDDENAKHPDDQWRVKDFSATILIAALKRDKDGGIRLATFSIGDGAIAWKVGNAAQIMCSPDSGEFGGGTRFLSTPEVWKKIFPKELNEVWTWETFCKSRVHCRCFSKDETSHFKLFLMTDGVSDPWFETDVGLENPKKWVEFSDEILFGDGYNRASLSVKDGAEKSARKLLNWLNFRIPGNHDDRTLIVVNATGTEQKEVSNG